MVRQSKEKSQENDKQETESVLCDECGAYLDDKHKHRGKGDSK